MPSRSSVTITTEAEPAGEPADRRGDRIFAGLARGAGITILVALAGVFIFLADRGHPRHHTAGRRTTAPLDSFWPYVGTLLFGTIFAALIALVIAVPFALGVALFISHYAPAALAAPVAYVIDLLAAVPSVVFGLWGARVLGPATWCRSTTGSTTTSASSRSSRARLGHRQDRAHRGHRAGDHDPADHHRDQPRDLRPDAAAQRGGRARARRHPVGDDPALGLPLRPLRASSPR